MAWILLVSLLLLVALTLLSRRWVWAKAATLSLLLVALSSWWLIDRLSGDGINAATLYHLSADMEGAGVGDFKGYIAAYVALLLASLLPLALPRIRRFARDGRGHASLAGFVALFVVAIGASPLYADGRRIYHQLQPVDYGPVVAEYARPEQPLAKPRNIVWIYGESLERTYLDEKAFPGLMPHLSQLAAQGLDFRGIDSAEGGGWTIAGLVSSMCGVPLTTSPGDENSMGRMGRFLPEAQCLGDYLKAQGYSNHYVGGATGLFAGKGHFLESHGFDEVRDLEYFQQRKIGPEHFSTWGVHDDVMLDDAWASYQKLARAGKPFMLTALTMDTHHPAGHLPVSCKDTRYESRYGDIGLLNALKCSDRLIYELVQKIRNSPQGEDTVIVIASDHLAMPNDLSRVLAKLDRENLLLFLGKDIVPQQVAVENGTTLDSGATLLSLLDPKVDAIGFGRSLLLPASARASASAAAFRHDGKDYPRYLAFARSLWTGPPSRSLRMDEDERVVIGSQQVKPPVLLEYDKQWNIKAVYLENTSRQFERTNRRNTLAYVDRCTAFEDGSVDGDWCALLVDRHNGRRLVHDADLKRGIEVGAGIGQVADNSARVRQSFMITRKAEKANPGHYILQVWARQQPTRPFWIEAISAKGKVVMAQQWVQPDASGRISGPLGLDQEVDDLEIRAWLDYTERLAVENYALVPSLEADESS